MSLEFCHVTKAPCRMLNLRKVSVALLLSSRIEFKKNVHVTLLILGVYTHNGWEVQWLCL